MNLTDYASKEYEQLIPRISPIHFTKENSAKEHDVSYSTLEAMLELRQDWKIVGWARSVDVVPREFTPYVTLFEEDGERIWCHCGTVSFMEMAEIIRSDPSKIAPLR